MPYLTPEELKSHMYSGIMDAIDESDDKAIVDMAIKAAQAEATGFLSNYDTAAIFDSEGDDRNPILLLYVKDIAVWHFIQLGNPNIEIAFRERRYELATKWLDKVQSGKVTPDLPVPEVEEALPQPGKLKYGSNPQRSTHY